MKTQVFVTHHIPERCKPHAPKPNDAKEKNLVTNPKVPTPKFTWLQK